MIKTDVFYSIKCNRCGRIYTNEDGEQYYGDKFEALDDADQDGWLTINEDRIHYCPNCLTENGDIKDSYPKEALEVERFVKEYIIKMKSEDYHCIEEMGDGSYFIYGITLSYLKPEGITDIEKEMIRQLAGNYNVDIQVKKLPNDVQEKIEIKLY